MPYEVHECLRSHRVWTSPESCSIRLSPVFDYKRVLQICRAKFVDTTHELESYETDGDMICSVPWGVALGEHPIGGTGQGDAQSCGLDAETFKCTCSVSGVSLAIGIAASKAPDHTVGCIAVAGG